MDTDLADQLCKGLGLSLTPLPHTITAKGYDGHKGATVTHYLSMNLIINGRRQYNIPFLVLKLRTHEVILSRMWFKYFYINPDVTGRRLI